MHPVIRLCLTVSLLSEAWGYITGGEASRYWFTGRSPTPKRANCEPFLFEEDLVTATTDMHTSVTHQKTAVCLLCDIMQ